MSMKYGNLRRNAALVAALLFSIVFPAMSAGAQEVSHTAPTTPPPNLATLADFAEVELDGIVFIKITAGTFSRGTTDAQRETLQKLGLWNPLFSVEQPAKEVRMTQPFLLGKYEVTQAQWVKVMGERNPSAFKGLTLPVETVSWNDTQVFCQKLSEQSKAKYRLPTEAEWEYAARAGDMGPFGLGADKQALTRDSLDQYTWMNANSGNKTHPVGEKKPNAWGVYDMLGNVWEWCLDGYAPDAYAKTSDQAANPSFWSDAVTERVMRGGCWFLDHRAQRVAVRGGNLPTLKNAYVGFRLVREL